MTLQQIKYVLGVAECGSFNRAAEKLYISQPSLTASIHDLERELGFQIFNRSARGTTATERGENFISDAKNLYTDFESFLKKYTAKEKKSFSVAALYYTFARKAFVEVVKNFSEKDYDFSFRELRAMSVIDDVANEKSDVGILYLSENNRDEISKALQSKKLDFHHLTECNAFVYMHKNHPLAKKTWISVDELSDYRFVTFDTDDVKSFFSEEIIEKYSLNQPITVADRATELNLIKNLNGYTFLSGVLDEETNEDFVSIPLKNPHEDSSFSFDLGYIIKSEAKLDEIARLYIEKVHQILKKSNPHL